MKHIIETGIYHHYAAFIGLSALWMHHFLLTFMLFPYYPLEAGFLMLGLVFCAPMLSYLLPKLNKKDTRVRKHQKLSVFGVSCIGIYITALSVEVEAMTTALALTSYVVAGLILFTLMCYLVSRDRVNELTLSTAVDAILLIGVGGQLTSLVAVGVFFGGISPWVLFITNAVAFGTVLATGFAGRELIDKVHSHYEKTLNEDELTGLLNRRGLYQIFDRARDKIKPQEKLLIFVVDIDYFKLFNDTYGHAEGDVCLKMVSRHLECLFSQSIKLDVCRYGGEEFVCLGVVSDDNATQFFHSKIIECWKEKSSLLNVAHEKSPFGMVTLSAGGGEFSSDVVKKSNFNTLFEKVDSSLYEAKEKRGSVVLLKSS